MIKQRKIAKYVLLQIVTLGIYGLFFWSDWTEDLNKICEDDDKESANYILVFLLDIFSLGINSFVWNYAQSERMYRIAPKFGIELKHGGSYILLLRTILFFLPVVGSVEKIKLFNTLTVAYNASLSEEEIIAAQVEEENQKKSKKELKAEKKQAKKDAKAESKVEKKSKKTKNAPSEEDVIIPTEAGVLPGLTDDTMPDITSVKAPEAVESSVDTFEAPVFEVVEPAAVEAQEKQEPSANTFEAPVFEVIEDVADASVVEIPEAPINEKAEVEFNEPVYEIADVEIPNLDFVETVTFEAPIEVETVDAIEFSEPAAYEISTDIPDVTFIDDEVLIPPVKEDILKKATKTVGTKRTVKEKVSELPEETEAVAKKTTKSTATKATKSTKEKKETATKSTKTTADKATKATTKKESTSKTTKAKKEQTKKEVEKLVEDTKIDDLTFGEITFEEVDLEMDILNEIEEISKSKK